MSEAFQIGNDPARDDGGETVVYLILGDDVHIIREPFASAILALIARKDARIERLTAALEYYGIYHDDGNLARAALSGDAE